MNDIPSSWGTAVNIQSMVFGNMGETSGTGVAFTRNPSTGEKALYGEYLMNAQGEDVVAGIRTPKHISTLKEQNPEIYAQFVKIAKHIGRALSRHARHGIYNRKWQAVYASNKKRKKNRSCSTKNCR